MKLNIRCIHRVVLEEIVGRIKNAALNILTIDSCPMTPLDIK
jgi:hypothetical protein